MPHGQRWAPLAGPPWDAAGGASAPWASPLAPLRSSTWSWHIKIPQKFPVRSENISRSKFLKQKDSKNRELALGILSIASSDKIHKNDVIDSKSM